MEYEIPIDGMGAVLPRFRTKGGVRQFSAVSKTISSEDAETVDQPYWDFVSVATGFSEAQFFVTPLGQSSKKKADTNLTTSGQITDGIAYHLHGIAFCVRDDLAAAIPAAEFRKILWTGMLEFSLSGRQQFQAHLTQLGWGGGPYVVPDAASAGTASFNHSGIPQRDSFYRLRNVIVIPKAVPFEVHCYWKAAVTLTATQEVGVRFEGRLVRAKIGK